MLVLYDAHCPLCRSLAAFMQQKLATSAVNFQAWQDFKTDPASACPPFPDGLLRESPGELTGEDAQLRVWTGTHLLAGEQAWLALVQEHPHLQGLSWLAAKLRLTSELGKTLQMAGSTLRRFCIKCKSRQEPKRPKVSI